MSHAYSQLTYRIQLGPSVGQDAMIWNTENCTHLGNHNEGKKYYNSICAWTWNSIGGCGKGEQIIYMQFPLESKIYKQSFFESATLKLFDSDATFNQTTVGNNEMWVQRVTSAWQ